MRTLLVAFALSFLTGLALTWLVRNLALRWGLVDEVGGRKIHRRPVPRFGGVAVALAFALPLAGLVLFYPNDISAALYAERPLLIALVGGGAIILALGLWDDLKGARAKVKFLGQILAALVVYKVGLGIQGITIPFVGHVMLGPLGVLATVFWFLLVTNALNLIDGMDGLAGGVAVLAATTLLVMSLVEGNILAAVLLAAMIGATAAFLVFNMNPASIFLGDTGSLFLGFLLALVSVHSSQKSYTIFSLVAAFVALGLPIFDLSMAVVRRTLTGRPMFSPDQHHVHHLLLRRGLSQRNTVFLLFGATAALGIAALVLIFSDDRLSAITILATGAAMVVAVNFLGYDKIIRAGRRNLVLGSIEEAAAERSRRLQDLRERLLSLDAGAGFWPLVAEALPHLGMSRAEVVLRSLPEEGWCWEAASAARPDDVHIQGVVELVLPLQVGRHRVLGELRLRWYQEDEVSRTHQQAVARLLAEAVTQATVDLVQAGGGASRVTVGEAVSSAT